jgi:hypothetical protein
MNFIPAKFSFIEENYGALDICDEEKQPAVATAQLPQIAIHPKLKRYKYKM